MELRVVRYETADGVATVTFNRPERLNSWTGRMATEYRWCLATADADPELRVVVGPARAADLLFSSRIVLAEEAAELGLVNRVLAPAELMPFTLDYARSMAAGVSPAALLAMKRQLYADLFRSLDDAVVDAEERT